MKATIKLFKAVPIRIKTKKRQNLLLLKTTIKDGFVFTKEVIGNYSKGELSELVEIVKEEVGLSGKKMNSSFHKSWQKVRDADIEQLVVEQIAHYLTTYGKEHPEEYLFEKEIQWGVDGLSEKVSELPDIEIDKVQDKDYVYIPKEALKIPKINIDKIRLLAIRGYTKKELKEKLLNLLCSGIALAEDTMKEVVDLSLYLELSEKEIRLTRNKEVRASLYEYLNLIPENPTEFLRLAIFKSIDKTLLIKDKQTIEEINSKKNLGVLRLFVEYDRKYGLERLAEIFYRFKPLFLAFRTNKKLKTITNRIRKLAKKYHKPMPEDYLNGITARIKRGEKIDKKKFESELSKVNTFRKVRLAYALKFRTKNPQSIIYKIRNGKGYATEFSFDKQEVAERVLGIVVDSIAKDVSGQVRGKKVYLPENIIYALPATEKQFTGNFPSGTYIKMSKDMVFGVHWENVKGHMIDLDLSLVGVGGKYGWDSAYRSEGRDILFSGDITTAPKPNGASELFYVKRQVRKFFLMFVNYYNFDESIEVPIKIFVAKERVTKMRKNYIVNPNNVLMTTQSKINKKQTIAGLLAVTEDECRFYFSQVSVGNSISSSNSKPAKNSRKYLKSFYQNTLTLNGILEKAGAKITTNKKGCDIDLSPESLEKDSIIRLLKKGN